MRDGTAWNYFAEKKIKVELIAELKILKNQHQTFILSRNTRTSIKLN